MTKILVTGASGLLGLNFCLKAGVNHEVVGVVNKNLIRGISFPIIRADLSKEKELDRVIEESNPDLIIHCAAMANIDDCERDAGLARIVNADMPGYLAKRTFQKGIRFVHISTDAIFDGTKEVYIENDTPNPLSVYAQTKWEGEQQVLEMNPDAIIARVNFYGWSLSGRRSLAEWFFNNLSAENPIKGFKDVNFCPLLVNDLVDVLLKMDEKKLSGLFHVLSSECLSKYAFGVELARTFGFDEKLITPVSWEDGGLKAARSPNLNLSTKKLAIALGGELPDQRTGMGKFHQQYTENFPKMMQSLGVRPNID
ncbi:MAG: SDR family oxidoreductase [Anaerolineaceae bacterium]|nr:SDR family oxidoreductase [Anaerolineaceae bacterium]